MTNAHPDDPGIDLDKTEESPAKDDARKHAAYPDREHDESPEPAKSAEEAIKKKA